MVAQSCGFEIAAGWRLATLWESGAKLPEPPMDLAEVTCPTCFEVFEVAMPHPDEMPAEVDYDCEICCRPMVIVFTEEDVYAKGLGD